MCVCVGKVSWMLAYGVALTVNAKSWRMVIDLVRPTDHNCSENY